MKLAVMQPYFFPHIGYFQLIKEVDKFISYDDVTFIKQGWIARNRLLANGRALLFSIPLSGSGSHVLIRNVKINELLYIKWKVKFLRTLEQYYKKAPYYKEVLSLVQEVFDGEPSHVSSLALLSIKSVCAYLNICTVLVEAGTSYNNSDLKGEARVIDICRQERADIYVNTIGGQKLYLRENFSANGIDLQYIKSKDVLYNQFQPPFVPGLSIIDVLMFNPICIVQEFLCKYEII